MFPPVTKKVAIEVCVRICNKFSTFIAFVFFMRIQIGIDIDAIKAKYSMYTEIQSWVHQVAILIARVIKVHV